MTVFGSAPREPAKVPKSIARVAALYLARLQGGERLFRDSHGRMQWANGRRAGRATIRHMLEVGSIVELDTDLFGDRKRGQSLGMVQKSEDEQ